MTLEPIRPSERAFTEADASIVGSQPLALRTTIGTCPANATGPVVPGGVNVSMCAGASSLRYLSKYANECRTSRHRETGQMPAEAAMSTYMTTEELADYLKVPVNSIYQWRVRGAAPPAAKVGRHMRWNLADVDRWLAERTD